MFKKLSVCLCLVFMGVSVLYAQNFDELVEESDCSVSAQTFNNFNDNREMDQCNEWKIQGKLNKEAAKESKQRARNAKKEWREGNRNIKLWFSGIRSVNKNARACFAEHECWSITPETEWIE